MGGESDQKYGDGPLEVLTQAKRNPNQQLSPTAHIFPRTSGEYIYGCININPAQDVHTTALKTKNGYQAEVAVCANNMCVLARNGVFILTRQVSQMGSDY